MARNQSRRVNQEGFWMAGITVKDLQPRAQQALQDSPIYALREVRVKQTGDSLMLCGRVSSFYHKQLAQELILAMAEGLEVVNAIDVR
jgi:hypothetical protein